MNHLFSPFRIMNIELKNRIVLPALASFLLEDGGTITDQTIQHYRRRAEGGPAMVIMEACAVSPEGVVSRNQARIDHDRHIEGLARIAAVIKSEGAIPAIQIHHAGRQTSAKVIRQKPLAPSPLPCPTMRGDVTPLTLDGIRKLVVKFGRAAVRAREAGFELIEVHGAHGYLVNQFLSGFSNIRTDAYGGDIEGRTRFALEIVREIRDRLGKEFPLSFKISAQEFVTNGLTIDQSIEILKFLLDTGVNAVQVSAGNDATPEWICQPIFMEKACLADAAQTIKNALNVPVMAVGRINDPLTAEEVIADGKADLVCIGRGLMADPQLPKKAQAGRFNDIRTCIACNTCMESIFKRGRLECLVNPSLCRETEMVFKPTKRCKKVMVIGGGPGGLNVAWVAAKRGHDVHLFEKQTKLGGNLIIGSIPGYKKELESLIRFQKTQVEKYGVTCHLGCRATATTVQTVQPEVVILSTGSVPIFPDIEGIDKNHVVAFDVSFNGDGSPYQKTVVIGGGATGCEVALHLSEQGCTVAMVEITAQIGGNLESITKKVLLHKLKENHVQILTLAKVLEIKDDGVVVADTDNHESYLEAQRVVIAVGSEPNETIFDDIQSLGYEVHRIGDCVKPRTAKSAIFEGAVLGRSI